MISLLHFTKRSVRNWKIYKSSLLLLILPSAFVHAQQTGYNNTYQEYYQKQSGYYDYNNDCNHRYSCRRRRCIAKIQYFPVPRLTH